MYIVKITDIFGILPPPLFQKWYFSPMSEKKSFFPWQAITHIFGKINNILPWYSGSSFGGYVLLDSFNTTFRDAEYILEQIYTKQICPDFYYYDLNFSMHYTKMHTNIWKTLTNYIKHLYIVQMYNDHGTVILYTSRRAYTCIQKGLLYTLLVSMEKIEMKRKGLLYTLRN